MVRRFIALMAFTSLALLAPASSQDLYCDQQDLGHWFYCEDPEPQPEPVEIQPESPPVTLTDDEILLAEAEAFKQDLEDARLLAAYDPNPDRIEYYQRMQQVAVTKASLMSDHWRRNVWSDPSLDYTTQRPVAQYAKHVWLDERRDERIGVLENLSDRYGLFYFYRSDCPFCQRFAPVLRNFADTYSVEVSAVSVDGGPSPEFPNARFDAGQFQKLLQGRKSVVPAVMILDTVSGDAEWVSFGALSREELAERIFVTVSREPGEDF